MIFGRMTDPSDLKEFHRIYYQDREEVLRGKSLGVTLQLLDAWFSQPPSEETRRGDGDGERRYQRLVEALNAIEFPKRRMWEPNPDIHTLIRSLEEDKLTVNIERALDILNGR